MERQRRIAPALLEDAVDLVEQEEQAVLLVEGEFHLTRAEGLARDDVRARELQDEHRAVGVYLEHRAVGLRGQSQNLCTHSCRIPRFLRMCSFYFTTISWAGTSCRAILRERGNGHEPQ